MKRTLIIHGHFYQPPRENPWTGMLERQESAFPANNWNERIFNECYLHNARAVITNPSGENEEINNYEYISFNIGPTLASWIAETHIDTFRKILQADWKNNNAIALPYNHTILPLDKEHIRKIQIAWGIQEFQMRYKRYPEGMWLPECAVNGDVVRDLIKSGIKFIVLTPEQAESVKRMFGKHTYTTQEKPLDIRQPYRIFMEEGYIDVFFSHHELAVDISFRKMLDNPAALADNIEKAFGTKTSENMVLTIVTDGETFGHHHKGAEKGLARLLKYELPARGIEISTYSKYLQENSVKWMVNLRENSSWSCPHGVKRWHDDCGCGADEKSDLKWRAPLRNSLNWLADRVIELFDERCPKYFKVPLWEAVRNYGQVPANYSKLQEFHNNYVNDGYKGSVEVNKIMEIINYTCYMFTSCGWFFGSISRLEPVQNLSYALIVIDTVQEMWGVELMTGFCDILYAYPEAVYIWNAVVKNRRVPLEKMAEDFLAGYRQTGIRRNMWGNWYYEVIREGSEDRVLMENSRTGQTFKF
ncbi:MAG: DUF3536 domain-containing protein [Elusimicrobia bacterium]|nr:DUF3536 domain-containing protein [Elusimicrobiota bacterium]